MSIQMKKHMRALQQAAKRMADPILDEEELGKIEKQMAEACGKALDAEKEPEMAEEPEMAAKAEDGAMDVGEEEEESLEVEVKSEARARDGSKPKGKGQWLMRTSKLGTPSGGGETRDLKNVAPKGERPEMAPEDEGVKKRKSNKGDQKARALVNPRGLPRMGVVAHHHHHLQQRLFWQLKARDGTTRVF